MGRRAAVVRTRRARVPVRVARWLRRRQNGLIGLVAVGVSGALVLGATNAAFTATTTNPGNAFAAGTVALSDDDAGSALFSLGNLKPGDSDTRCITVTYTGSLGAQLRMYAATTGTGLGPYLTLKLTRGSFATPPGGGDCTGFTADTTDYISHGNGVLYDAALSSFAGTWATGTVDPSATTFPTPEVWTAGEKHAYQLTVTLPSGTANAAQGLTANTTVTWETRDASDTVSAGPGSYYANAVLADNPVGFWRLNEPSGTNADDATSGNRDGTYVNGAVLGASGPLRDGQTSVALDGSNDRVSVPYAGALNPANFTLEAWVRPTAGAGPDRAVVTSWYYPGSGYVHDGYWLGIDSSNKWAFVVGDGSWDARLNSPGAATMNGWTHVVATYDGWNTVLYVNGSPVASAWGVGYAAALAGTPWQIGAEWGGGSALAGSVADVALYNTALSATQVQAHYNARN